jgi:hypothetical protein
MRIFFTLCAIALAVSASANAEPCAVKLEGIPDRLGPRLQAEDDVYRPIVLKLSHPQGEPSSNSLRFILNGTEVSLPLGKIRSRGNESFETEVDLAPEYSRLREGANELRVELACAGMLSAQSSRSFL